MPIARRENGSWLVTVCIDGRRYRKTDRRWTYQDARAYERAVQSQARTAARGEQPQRTVGDALKRWLTDYVPKLRSAQRTRWKARVLLPYVDRPLAEVPQVWAEIRAAKHKLAPSTINHAGRILRRLGRLAWQDWQWINSPPAIHLLHETPRERFLEPREVESLALACHDYAAAGYVLLAAYTGIRRGHLLRLTSHDVRDGYIELDRSGKTQRLQHVPVHPRVAEYAGKLPLGISDKQLRAAWDRARKETGIRCRWHDLRHSCASWLVQAGVPLLTVAEILGHSSTAVTRRYAHLAPEHLKQAMLRIK